MSADTDRRLTNRDVRAAARRAGQTPNLMPAAALWANMKIPEVTGSIALTSQTMKWITVKLPGDLLVTELVFKSSSTGMSGVSNSWAALFDRYRGLISQSPNNTGLTWTNDQAKAFALGTPFRTPRQGGIYGVGIMIHATTTPTLLGVATAAAALNEDVLPDGATLIAGGNSTASLTTTAPDPAAAPSAVAGTPWVWIR